MTSSNGDDYVEFEIVVGPADIQTYCKFMRAGPQRHLVRRQQLMTAVFGGLFALLMLISDPPWWWFALFAAGLVLVWVVSRSNTASQFEVQSAASDGVFAATAERVTLRRPKWTTEFAWSAVEDVAVMDGVVILRLSSAVGFVLPKRCMGPGQLEQLLRLAHDRAKA